MPNPNDQQIGGQHYKKYPVQPWDYIIKNSIPWAEGCIIEWVTRWRDKGGVQDLEKAKHMIDKVIEMAGWSKEPRPEIIPKIYTYDPSQIRYEPPCDCERCSAE